ncbi:hypothetical protein QBC37DRAFT_422256 [Rhypophila decipiens]|uniref:Uncharacterized protein n=1 Tax=Rhypophila decipiens TaxID=261697 RepID=A0AAN6Y7H1_9PEZI|nr:hypothetical protein QBC37DRAFT_422256 [Rhypophila decipiens]
MEFESGRTTRGPQYSKDDNDTNLYISAAGEDQLDDDAHNPFKQDFSQPIPDPDDAALAALAGRYTPPQNTSNTSDHVTGDKRERASPGLASTPPDLTHSEGSSHEDHEPGDGDEDGRPAKKRRRKYSESSRDLLVQPGDDVEEEDRKMRANLQRFGSTVEEEVESRNDADPASEGHDQGLSAENTKPEDAASNVPADETTRPSESDATDVVGVEPVPLMDQLGDGPGGMKKESMVIPDDDDEGTEKSEEVKEDDDIEPKEGDDYDVENYAVFEDDQDDAGQELEEDGPDMDERQMINEEELVPAWGGKDQDQGGNGNL